MAHSSCWRSTASTRAKCSCARASASPCCVYAFSSAILRCASRASSVTAHSMRALDTSICVRNERSPWLAALRTAAQRALRAPSSSEPDEGSEWSLRQRTCRSGCGTWASSLSSEKWCLVPMASIAASIRSSSDIIGSSPPSQTHRCSPSYHTRTSGGALRAPPRVSLSLPDAAAAALCVRRWRAPPSADPGVADLASLRRLAARCPARPRECFRPCGDEPGGDCRARAVAAALSSGGGGGGVPQLRLRARCGEACRSCRSEGPARIGEPRPLGELLRTRRCIRAAPDWRCASCSCCICCCSARVDLRVSGCR
jgi:hypothetical protein